MMRIPLLISALWLASLGLAQAQCYLLNPDTLQADEVSCDVANPPPEEEPPPEDPPPPPPPEDPPPSEGVIVDFSTDGLSGFETYNTTANVHDMEVVNDQAQILIDADGTLWWNENRGEAERLLTRAMPGDTWTIHGVFAADVDGSPLTPVAWSYRFGFVMMMQNDNNWEAAMVGQRAENPGLMTVEQKITINDDSSQSDVGDIGQARADIRITVLGDGTLQWEYRPVGGTFAPLNTAIYAGSPRIDCSSGCDLLIGGYAYLTKGLPFIGGVEGPITLE